MSGAPERGAPLAPLLDYRPALVGGQGIGRYVRELVRALVSIEGVTPRLFGPTRKRLELDRSSLGIGDARLFSPRLPSKPLTAILRSIGLGTERLVGGADVVHHTQYRRLPSRLPGVATIHDLVFLDTDRFVSTRTAERMSAFVREAARTCSVLITPSETVADEVAERLGVDREAVIATPLGVDHVERMARDDAEERAVQHDVDAHGPFLFTAARIERRKNLAVILRALEALGDEAPRWKIAGVRGDGASEFEDELRRSPVASRVEVLGHVSEARLRAHIEACAAFVLVPLDEGFGLGPLEAMALGRPAITSDVPVVREVCGGGAVLVAPDDVEGLARELASITFDPDRSAEASRTARLHAATFTWQRTAARTVDAYRRALGSGAERSPLR